MKTRQKANDQFGPEESARRFDAALRGAFNTPPTPMKDIPRKRPKHNLGGKVKR